MISLFIIIPSFNVSSVCFESDLTLWTRTVIVFSDISFLLWKINHFVLDVHIQAMNFYVPLLHIIKISLYIEDYHVFIPLNLVYIYPCKNGFGFCRSKSITPCPAFKTLTIWTVDVHANAKGNGVCLMDVDIYSFFIVISVSHFSIGTKTFICLNKKVSLPLSQNFHQKSLHIP